MIAARDGGDALSEAELVANCVLLLFAGYETTTHLIANPVLDVCATGDAMVVRSAWTCHIYTLRNRTQHVFFGRYEHHLVRLGGDWRIQHKKITLMNDFVPAMLDVFCV